VFLCGYENGGKTDMDCNLFCCSNGAATYFMYLLVDQ